VESIPTVKSQFLALFAAVSVTALGVAHGQPPNAGAGHSGGIWKAAVPPKPMKGEFDDFDPLGIAAGARIKADCSLNWINPDDGKLYCFSSGTSLVYFLDKPQANLQRARAGWRKLTASQDLIRPASQD
jgi:hypothetical protein